MNLRIRRLLSMRSLRYYGPWIICIAATFAILKIYYEAWTLGIPVWYVTKYRWSLQQGSETADYFTEKPGFEKEVYETYRTRFQMEYAERMAASELDLEAHFDDLERTVMKPLEMLQDMSWFIGKTIERFEELKLSFEHPERLITTNGKSVIWETLFKDDPFEVLNEQNLLDLMQFPDYFLMDLSLKHKLVIDSLPIEQPEFYQNEAGYVYLGGGKYTWLTYMSIKFLRDQGSKLPVEVIIPSKSEFDPQMCQELFPKLNAKCIILPKLPIKIKGYQLKPLAILFSTFKQVMYIDSDIIPVVNPDRYFRISNSESLLDRYGLVTWPDFWRRTSSPLLYKSLGIQVGSTPTRFLDDIYTPTMFSYKGRDEKQYNYHDLPNTLPDWTTEAGLLMINKITHFNVLLLALYYNLNGPTGYYPLISQGGAGEGDKDTWALAARYLQARWWQVSTKPRKLYGTWVKPSNYIVDSTIVQVDLSDDYEGLLGLVWGQDIWRKEMVKQVGEDQFAYNYQYSLGSEAWSYASALGGMLGKGQYGLDGGSEDVWEPLNPDEVVSEVKAVKRPKDGFYHIHSPKLDPRAYLIDDKFTDMNGKQMRNFGEVEWLDLGYDLELKIWEVIKESFCTDEEIRPIVRSLKFFNNDENLDKICDDRIDKRIEWLKRDGENQLKKYQKEAGGWKLKGNTRLLMHKRILRSEINNHRLE